MSVCRYCGIEWVGVPDSLPLLTQGLATSVEDYQTSPQSSPSLILLKTVCLIALLESSLDKCCSLLTAVQRALACTARHHDDDDNTMESIKDENMFELAVKVKGQLEIGPHGVDLQYYQGMCVSVYVSCPIVFPPSYGIALSHAIVSTSDS